MITCEGVPIAGDEYVPLVKQPSCSAVIKAAMASRYLSILEVDVGIKLS